MLLRNDSECKICIQYNLPQMLLKSFQVWLIGLCSQMYPCEILAHTS